MSLTPKEAKEFGELTKMVEEIHLAVIGNGSAGSSLRERVSTLEAGNDWKHKLIAAAVPTVLGALFSHLGIPLSLSGGTHT